jgi:hypothetical protein
MADDLSQQEADLLFAMEKKCLGSDDFAWPSLGGKVVVELSSLDGREEFMLDVTKTSVKLTKLMLQNRARTTLILARLEINGAPHRNPDDAELPCPHIHLYREGYGDKWAFPVPVEHFRDLSNHMTTVEDFMRYCRIVQPPRFSGGLFA